MSFLRRLFESPEAKVARLAAEAKAEAARLAAETEVRAAHLAAETLRLAKEQLCGPAAGSAKIQAALAIADMPGGIHVLLDALSKGDYAPETQTAAAIGLAKVGPPAVAALIQILDHAYVDVRRLAAGALADIAAPGTFDALAALVLNERVDADVRKAAIFGLGNIGDQRAVELLIHLGENKKEQMTFLRRAAYTALTCLGGPRAVQALEEAASSGDGYVQASAAKALAAGTAALPAFTRRSVRVLTG